MQNFGRENFDDSTSIRQNSSDFSTVKVLRYTVCMPEARGLRAYISGKSRMAMLQVLCITLFPIVTTPVVLIPQVFVTLVRKVISTNAI